MKKMLENDVCRECLLAQHILRRLGFRDHVSWGPMEGSPNLRLHASHSNSRLPDNQEDPKQNPARPPNLWNLQVLCCTYRGELAWLIADRPVRPLIYLAHPVAGNFRNNVRSAEVWLRWLRRLSVWQLSVIVGHFYLARPVITAPWLGGIEKDVEHPGGRVGALADCKEMVGLFDEIWFVNRVSDGMREEASSARQVRDLTYLGAKPPSNRKFLEVMTKRSKQ